MCTATHQRATPQYTKLKNNIRKFLLLLLKHYSHGTECSHKMRRVTELAIFLTLLSSSPPVTMTTARRQHKRKKKVHETEYAHLASVKSLITKTTYKYPCHLVSLPSARESYHTMQQFFNYWVFLSSNETDGALTHSHSRPEPIENALQISLVSLSHDLKRTFVFGKSGMHLHLPHCCATLPEIPSADTAHAPPSAFHSDIVLIALCMPFCKQAEACIQCQQSASQTSACVQEQDKYLY